MQETKVETTRMSFQSLWFRLALKLPVLLVGLCSLNTTRCFDDDIICRVIVYVENKYMYKGYISHTVRKTKIHF